MKGKKEEFEKYRPNLNNGFASNLSDEDVNFFYKYFTDPQYSKHPVVFVSPEGALAYCNWLQELMNETNLGKNKNAIVRLPSKWEWERAAAGGKEHVFYGTATGELSSGFMHHNPEANYFDYQENNFAFSENKHLKKEKHSDKIFHFTTPVKSFRANPYGLYDMSGNVSEMVVDVSGKILVKGGSWNSSQEFLRIRDDDFNEFPILSPLFAFHKLQRG
jgi:formylglycine-generating enzyme required for sulfatase activity